MKTRFLIIIGIVVGSIGLGSFAYVLSVQSQCESLLGDTHYPRPLTLWNCVDYLRMIQENPEPDVTDSLKISNAERDAKLAAGYKLYPGVGWVHPDDLGNQQPIYKDNPDNPGELILVIDAMIAHENSSSDNNIPENSQYCTTELYVKTKEKIDRKFFEVIIRDEIAKFGTVYDIDDRYVLLTDMGENRTRISLDGLWSLEPDRPNLVESLTALDFVNEVEKYLGIYLVVECQ